MGRQITSKENSASIEPNPVLNGQDIAVPGDISLQHTLSPRDLWFQIQKFASVIPVGINPTRDGILRVAKSMGADIKLENETTAGGEQTVD